MRQNVKSPEETRAKAEREYADYMTSIGHSDPVGLTNMLTGLMDERKNIELRKWMNGMNPRVNRLFTAVAGLPAKTQKEADASLRSMDPIRWDKWLEHKEEERLARREARDLASIKRELTAQKVEFKGKVMSMAMFFLEVISDGYTDLREFHKGAAKQWYLCRPGENQGFKVGRRMERDFIVQLLKDLEDSMGRNAYEVRVKFVRENWMSSSDTSDDQESCTVSPGA